MTSPRPTEEKGYRQVHSTSAQNVRWSSRGTESIDNKQTTVHELYVTSIERDHYRTAALPEQRGQAGSMNEQERSHPTKRHSSKKTDVSGLMEGKLFSLGNTAVQQNRLRLILPSLRGLSILEHPPVRVVDGLRRISHA